MLDWPAQPSQGTAEYILGNELRYQYSTILCIAYVSIFYVVMERFYRDNNVLPFTGKPIRLYRSGTALDA